MSVDQITGYVAEQLHFWSGTQTMHAAAAILVVYIFIAVGRIGARG